MTTVTYLAADATYSTTLDKVTLTNADTSPYTATSRVATVDASARSKAITITGNALANSIVGGSGKDIIDGAADNDSIFGNAGNDSLSGGAGADYLVGGKGSDTFNGGAGADVFFYENGDGADTIVDYTESEDTIQIKGVDVTKVAASKSGNLKFTVTKGSISVVDGVGKKIKFVDENENVVLNQSFGESLLTITNDDFATINTAIDAAVMTVDASARTDSINIIGNAKNNLIQLGASSATVASGNGKDTIVANSSGQLLLTDYTVGKDILKFDSAITNAEISSNDVIFTFAAGTVTVEGGKDKKITIVDSNGNKTSQVYASPTVTAANTDGSPIRAFGDTIVLDASKRKNAVMLIGNDADNTIIGGKNGNKTYDTLTGGSGADVFVYNKGAGNDIITDYSVYEGDVIQLGKGAFVTSAQTSGSDYIFTLNKSGTITVKDGASQSITFKNSNGMAFNYQAVVPENAEVAFEERWFMESAIQNSELDSIIEDKTISLDENNFNDEDVLKKSIKNIEIVQNSKSEK